MIMRYLYFLFVLVLCKVSSASAQNFDEYKRQQQAKYNNYVQKKTEEFRAYRDKVNAEYADYMRKAWTKEEAQPAKPFPKRPEPPKPEVRKPTDIPKYDLMPIGEVLNLKLPDIPKPKPIIPIDELEQLVNNDNLNANANLNDNLKVDDNDNSNLNHNESEKPKVEGFAFQWCGQTWRVPLEAQHRFRLRGMFIC